ncbi:MAG: hypothetical protein SF182_10600 [Deltaproteobacteria bacterium]|nr:hypothetical protein [Deltaproteobacteria bacterium]
MGEGEASQRKGIKDVFYETRALSGREYTVRRFASEVLGGSVSPLLLGYIEKGKRIPSEALVRRLAAVRKQDPQELLALLWRDRMLHAFGRELRRVLRAPVGLHGIDDADLAVLVSQAIAALPEEGEWVTLARWRKKFRTVAQGRRTSITASAARVAQVEAALKERKLIEVRAGKVRRRGHHYVAESVGERRALALEFCALFAKGLLDKLALGHLETGTYLRNHFVHVDPQDLPEIHRRLDEAVAKIADEFARSASPERRFLNMLITSTPF